MDYLGPGVSDRDDTVRNKLPLPRHIRATPSPAKGINTVRLKNLPPPRPADTPCAVRRGIIGCNAKRRGINKWADLG